MQHPLQLQKVSTTAAERALLRVRDVPPAGLRNRQHPSRVLERVSRPLQDPTLQTSSKQQSLRPLLKSLLV
ncbi:hypothetical protein TcasGA2_TC003576 [Tribolium castaneum]|uniref:Uncharacterized protein n=1 Tax=Tribolium castaneum TaxID=7070 RepID=D6WHV0_TRICA|nr:hypothetical protein TcasGA2_TC003576 [Tribolium castaneum]